VRHNFDFEIYSSSIKYAKSLGISYFQFIEVESLRFSVRKNEEGVQKKILDAITDNPKNPLFYELLYIYYIENDLKGAAQMLANDTIRKYPNFIKIKIEVINNYRLEGKYEKLKEFFAGKFEITDFFSNQNQYYIDDVISFYFNVLFFYIEFKNLEKAEELFAKYKKVYKNKKHIAMFADAIATLKKSIELDDEYQRLKIILKNDLEKHNIVSTEKPPVFNHPEIENLYRYSFDIDKNIIYDLLQLPRKTLVEDLEKVLMDCIYRFEYFFDKFVTLNYKMQSFPVHAIILLTELKSKQSSDIIFKLFEFNDNILEYWFGDTILNNFHLFIYNIENEHLDKYAKYIKNQEINFFVKCLMADAINCIYFEKQEMRNEIVEWYGQILLHYKLTQTLNNRKDIIFLNYLLANIIEIKAITLTDLVKSIIKSKNYSTKFLISFRKFKRMIKLPNDETHKTFDMIKIYDKLLEQNIEEENKKV